MSTSWIIASVVLLTPSKVLLSLTAKSYLYGVASIGYQLFEIWRIPSALVHGTSHCCVGLTLSPSAAKNLSSFDLPCVRESEEGKEEKQQSHDLKKSG